jgi:hypothetical protein
MTSGLRAFSFPYKCDTIDKVSDWTPRWRQPFFMRAKRKHEYLAYPPARIMVIARQLCGGERRHRLWLL